MPLGGNQLGTGCYSCLRGQAPGVETDAPSSLEVEPVGPSGSPWHPRWVQISAARPLGKGRGDLTLPAPRFPDLQSWLVRVHSSPSALPPGRGDHVRIKLSVKCH